MGEVSGCVSAINCWDRGVCHCSSAPVHPPPSPAQLHSSPAQPSPLTAAKPDHSRPVSLASRSFFFLSLSLSTLKFVVLHPQHILLLLLLSLSLYLTNAVSVRPEQRLHSSVLSGAFASLDTVAQPQSQPQPLLRHPSCHYEGSCKKGGLVGFGVEKTAVRYLTGVSVCT